MIDYQKIADAILHYWQHFRMLEVPWMVSSDALDVTRPPGTHRLATPLGCNVASGEQSFVQMMMDEQLVPGRYMCCTPCFRDEPIVDDYHRNWFVKVELISVLPEYPRYEVQSMIDMARLFFNRHLPVRIVETNEGHDIQSHEGVEIGSYGLRCHDNFHWVYGTGVAEPRLSQAIELHEQGSSACVIQVKIPDMVSLGKV